MSGNIFDGDIWHRFGWNEVQVLVAGQDQSSNRNVNQKIQESRRDILVSHNIARTT